MSTPTEVLPEVDTELSEPDGLAHYCRITSLFSGGEQVALCGKRWIPTIIAGAEEREICARCAELMSFLYMMEP